MSIDFDREAAIREFESTSLYTVKPGARCYDDINQARLDEWLAAKARATTQAPTPAAPSEGQAVLCAECDTEIDGCGLYTERQHGPFCMECFNRTVAPTPAAAEGQAEAINEKHLRELISTLKNAEFDCGEWDGDASDQALYSAILQRANDATDAIVEYVLAAPLPRQAAVQGEDAARLDWLERRGNDGGLLLHAGNQDTGGHSGLGLINTGRTLRQAVDSARGAKAAKSAPATTEKDASDADQA